MSQVDSVEEFKLLRPRLTEAYGVYAAQNDLPFAIPFVAEDIPLYVDPFLLWKSPSQQDVSLHDTILTAFNQFGWMAGKGKRDEAVRALVRASECDEVGLGNSRSRKGKRIGQSKASEIIDLFERIPNYGRQGFEHIEEAQLYVDGISKDRVSDIACSILKSFLIDFTIDQCDLLRIPRRDVKINDLYDPRKRIFKDGELCSLPVNPETGAPIILVPKRWLRFVPWINFDDYFTAHCPQDDIAHPGEKLDRVNILNFNRENYGLISQYVALKERTLADCTADPLFEPVPVVSANRHLKRLKTLKSGKEGGADKEYERIMETILPSMMYPKLDFATSQSRTISGVSIRDLVFYNTKSTEFLKDLGVSFDCQQIVFELKNVRELEREHVDQLNRYLSPSLSRFGVFVTRNRPTRARMQQMVDLWSGQRKCIVTLTDEDIEMMVGVFESRQREPIDILKKKYFEFMQKVPT